MKVLLLVSLFVISILAGCGGDDAIDEEAVRVGSNYAMASPPSGSEIAANASITLTFDNAPADVTVSVGFAVPSGKTVTINGPFVPGPLNLTVTWADGTQTLTYIVTGPD